MTDCLEEEISKRIVELYKDESIAVADIVKIVNEEYLQRDIDLRLTHSKVERTIFKLVAEGKMERRRKPIGYTVKVMEAAKSLNGTFSPYDILRLLSQDCKSPPTVKTVIKILDSSTWAVRVEDRGRRRVPVYKHTDH